MKKSVLSIALLLMTTLTFAQKMQLQNTMNAMKYKELDKAKAAIDLACIHDDTKNTPKMWLWRGKTYIAIYDDTTSFHKLDADAAEKATESFVNCMKTDKDNLYTDEARPMAIAAAQRLYNDAMAAASDTTKYDKAIRCMKGIAEVIPFDRDNSLARKSNITKESIELDLFDINMQKGDKVTAKGNLQKLIDAKYKEPKIYMYMASMYVGEKDTVKALSYIDQGRELFEENSDLINAEIELYAKMGKQDKLLEKATKAIEVSPDNPMLYYVQGLIYQNKGVNDKAEVALKKSLELDPNKLEANFQLGKLYYDKGGDWLSKSQNLKPSEMGTKGKEYDTKAQEELLKSIPYFERAYEIDPKDRDVQSALLSTYRLADQMDKFNKLKKTMSESKAK